MALPASSKLLGLLRALWLNDGRRVVGIRFVRTFSQPGLDFMV